MKREEWSPNLEQSVENLWEMLEEIIEQGILGVKQEEFLPKDRHQSIIDIIARETAKRVKGKLYDDSWQAFGEHSTFMKKYGNTFAEEFIGVLTDIKEGKMQVPHPGEKVVRDMNLEKEEERVKGFIDMFNETSYRQEDQYLIAFEQGDYKKARTILEGLKATNEEEGTTKEGQLRNWDLTLSCAEGDVERFIELFSEVKALQKEDKANIVEESMKGAMQALLASRYCNGISIAVSYKIAPEKMKKVKDDFYDLVQSKLVRFFREEEDISAEKADLFAKSALEETASAISRFHPDGIRIIVDYTR